LDKVLIFIGFILLHTKIQMTENQQNNDEDICIKLWILVSYERFPHHSVRNMTSRVEPKSSELVSIFHTQTGWNLSRAKFFPLCKFQLSAMN
jgi:hypothetical protein